MQDNTSFGADFRIGKSFNAFDVSYFTGRQGCNIARCGGFDYQIDNVAKKHVFALLVRPPDILKCSIQSDRVAELEMQLRQPGFALVPLTIVAPGSTVFPLAPGPVVVGGNNQTSIALFTGIDAVRVSDGAILRDFWSLEVSARELVPAPTAPIPYSIVCQSGNGIIYARPYEAADDF